MLCDYAVADITGANPNVYYELGIRHAMRPRSTVILFADGTTLPFDIALLRGIPYRTNENGAPADPTIVRRPRSPDSSAPPAKIRTTTARCSSCSNTCRASRSITARPTSSATGSTIRRSTRSGSRTPARRASGRSRRSMAEPALRQPARGRGRRRRRSVPLVARREGLRRHDRALSAACRRRCSARASCASNTPSRSIARADRRRRKRCSRR